MLPRLPKPVSPLLFLRKRQGFFGSIAFYFQILHHMINAVFQSRKSLFLHPKSFHREFLPLVALSGSRAV